MARFTRAVCWWLAAGAIALSLSVTSYTRTDPDLWGHVRFGLDLAASHRLTALDPYSFTQDRPWINHEWLSERVMAAAWSAGGTAGLALLKAALATTALTIVWVAGARTEPAVRMGVIAFALLGTLPATLTLRPQLWTLVCLGVLAWTLARGSGRRARWWLPLLFAVWANLHGGWIVGLAVLGAWTAGCWLERSDDRRPLAALWALSALATLATPYGWHLWAFVLRTVRFNRGITEWQPVWTVWFLAVIWAIAAAATVFGLAKAPGRRWSLVLTLLVLACASARVLRIVPLFVTVAAVLLAEVWRRRWPAPALRAAGRPAGETTVAAGLCVLMIAAGAFVSVRARTFGCIGDGDADTWAPDREAAAWLEHAPPGRLVVFFDWGEYAIWHVGPRLRVAIDGRRETVYSDAVIARHDAIVNGRAEGFAALDEWLADYVWLQAASTPTRAWLAGHGYRIEFNGRRSFIAVRADLPPLVPPSAPRTPAAACFPD